MFFATVLRGTYTRYVHFRRRISSRSGGEPWSAELSSHTSAFCFNHNKLQLFALVLCAPLPTRQKTSLSSLIYKHKFACFCRAGVLVCVVQATAPCCWPRLAHKAQWHGFQPICIANAPNAVRCLQRTSDCYEVNRVSVSPTNDDCFCRNLSHI